MSGKARNTCSWYTAVEFQYIPSPGPRTAVSIQQSMLNEVTASESVTRVFAVWIEKNAAQKVIINI
jgi:hypothetical protein